MLALGPEIVAISTAIALMVAVILAWLLLNGNFPGRRFVNLIATAALALPAPLLCYYLLAELGHVWPLSRLGLALASILSALPYLLRSSRQSFAGLSPAYARAARSMGTPEWRVFARVELPLVWKPVLGAAGFALVKLLLELTAAFWIADLRV